MSCGREHAAPGPCGAERDAREAGTGPDSRPTTASPQIRTSASSPGGGPAASGLPTTGEAISTSHPPVLGVDPPCAMSYNDDPWRARAPCPKAIGGERGVCHPPRADGARNPWAAAPRPCWRHQRVHWRHTRHVERAAAPSAYARRDCCARQGCLGPMWGAGGCSRPHVNRQGAGQAGEGVGEPVKPWARHAAPMQRGRVVRADSMQARCQGREGRSTGGAVPSGVTLPGHTGGWASGVCPRAPEASDTGGSGLYRACAGGRGRAPRSRRHADRHRLLRCRLGRRRIGRRKQARQHAREVVYGGDHQVGARNVALTPDLRARVG